MGQSSFVRILILLVASLLLIPAAFTQTPPLKDPKAVALLQESLQAMGGLNLELITDLHAELTLKSKNGRQFVEGTARLKTLGRKMWRTDANGAAGVVATIFNGQNVHSRRDSGTEHFLALSQAEAGNWWFPWLSILGEWSEPDVQVEYLGIEGTEHKIRLRRSAPQTEFGDIHEPCDVFLDSTTMLPTRLTYQRHPADNLLRDIPAEVRYSDYRTVGGIQAPFQLSYSMRGALIFESRIVNLAANQGTAETDFSLE